MKGRIISDWSQVDLKSQSGRELFMGAMNHFLKTPDRAEVRMALQHFTLSGDFPAEVTQILEKYHLTPSFDEGWQQIFDVRDFTGTKATGFDILDVQSGLTFNHVKPGERIKIYKMSGDKVTVGFDMYGGALGWHRTWFDDNTYWLVEDTAIEFQNKAFQKRAQIFYSLIDAIPSGQNLAWQDPFPAGLANTDPNYGAVRDYRTINKACENILLAVKDKGYGVGDAAQFRILAPIQLKDRITRALGVANWGLSQGFPGVQYNVTPQYSMMLSASDKYYVCLPKLKCKAGIRQNMTMFGEFDIMTYTDKAAAYMRFGGAIGDIEQFQRCATA